jgi:hypothetical protein
MPVMAESFMIGPLNPHAVTGPHNKTRDRESSGLSPSLSLMNIAVIAGSGAGNPDHRCRYPF